MAKYIGLFKNAEVDEEGNMTDEVRMTYHQDISEIHRFKGKYNYTDEDYFICDLELHYGDLVEVEGSRNDYQ